MKLLNKIQQELKAPKKQENTFSSFNYRSCEDILEAVKPLLGEATLVLNDEIAMVGDRYYVKATVTLSDGKETVSASAYAREALTKVKFDESQITGAASSYARKYALNGLFCIDDTKDADSHDNTETAASVAAKVTPPATKAPAAATTSKPQPPAILADKIKMQKKIIRKMCDSIMQRMIDGGDPEAFELKTKEDYEGFVKACTGLTLETGNLAEIITRLEATK